MKWLNCAKMRFVLVGFVVTIVLGGGNAYADFSFGTPTNLGAIVNSSADEWGPKISADGLSLFFSGARPGNYGSWDIWVTMRETTEDDWGEPINLGPKVNGPYGDSDACISADGLSLFFKSQRPGGYGSGDIWVTTRPTTDADWGTPVNLGPKVNSVFDEDEPSISADGLSLFFRGSSAGGSGNTDIWVSTRATKEEPWGEPANLGAVVNSSSYEGCPFTSADGLLLFFHSWRGGGYGNGDIWVTTRQMINDPWGPPVNLGAVVNSSAGDWGPSISADGLLLYFSSGRTGGFGGDWGDIYQAPIIPIVDFNGDGNVDIIDLVILIEHLDTNEPLCDIGPMPWGDGIVDEADLGVLMSYWGQEVEDPTLAAYWKLDETEGDIAYDSARTNDASVLCDPVWQPEGGIVDGAIELDGIDDYISTPFVLNPYEGQFSVFAWIKGGSPGQVIISQQTGANWFLADPTEGNLMTELKVKGRSGTTLTSQKNIIDGNWHRIGLVWDGLLRTLYVDDISVAEGAQANLEGSYHGMYIGAGKALESDSFWSGLIDDVRIYNRAVTP